MKKKDIFDRIMEWRIFRPLQPFYKKYKEALLYLFFGGCTFLVGVITYAFFEYTAGFAPLIANLFSWVFAVTFAYVTNRIWVFEDVAEEIKGITREIFSFFSGRLVTLALEEVILYIGIDLLHINSMVVKILAQVLVIISNYFISKLFVFNGKKK